MSPSQAAAPLPHHVAAHIDLVRRLCRPGGPLSPSAPTASINNPAWFAGASTTPARRRLHSDLLTQALDAAGAVPAERHAIVMAGPPGAGKTGIRRGYIEGLGRSQEDFLVVDADDVKKALLRAAIADGSYETWIKPARVRALERDGERFFPLELSALVHEESARLAQLLRADAIVDGQNIVIDTVLSGQAAALALGQQLQAHGYQVSVLDVEVPYEVSEARIRGRWHEDYVKALAGRDDLGGRWVPSEYARGIFAGPGERSKPEAAAELLARRCGAVQRYQVHRTTAAGEAAVLEIDLTRARPGAPLEQARPLPSDGVAQSDPPRPVRRGPEAGSPTRRRGPAVDLDPDPHRGARRYPGDPTERGVEPQR